MGTRDSFTPGTFSWVELATSDTDAAKAFYADLFGWEYDDRPIGGGAVYSMAQLDGANAAAIFASEQAPHWNSYITVESADDAAEKVTAAGGTVAAEPFDVMEAGRTTVVQDPTGAAVCLWEPRDNPGAGIVNGPGALSWNDLMTNDVAKAAAFYCEVFGWEVADVPGAPDDRMAIRNGETMNGGMATLPESAGEAPPHWLPYFGIAEVQAAIERIEGGGGTVLAGPIDVPSGQFLLAADPQGAVFAMVAGHFDP